MKKYILGLTIAASTLSLAGCSDFLDTPVLGQQDLSEYFVNEDQCKQQITGCYQSIFWDDWWQVQKFYLCGDMCTDDMWMGNTTQDPGEYRDLAHYTGNTYSAGNCCQNFWQYRYKGILRCNVAIDRIPAVEFTDESLRDRYVAEAKFLRAFQYFDLVRNFGGVPLVIGLKLPSEVVGITRATIEQSYEQIERDLKEAIPALPKRSEYAANDLGRVTEGAAQGLLAKVYLYRKNYQEVVNELAPVVAAIHAGKDLMLVPMPQTFPNDLKTSKDIIFAVQYLKGGVGESVHQNNRYRNNDNGNIISLEQAEFESDKDNRKALVEPTGSGQRPGKFNAPATNNETSADFPVMRCAEVMLMYAEAANELAAVPTQDALDALNAVRTNAGLEGKTLAELSTKTLFRQAVYKERRLELALECDRWFDIVRTGQMAAIFPGIDAYRQLYPVPQTEIENVNDKAGWQNEGYALE